MPPKPIPRLLRNVRRARPQKVDRGRFTGVPLDAENTTIDLSRRGGGGFEVSLRSLYLIVTKSL